MSFRTYHALDGIDRSGLAQQVEAKLERVAARLSGVRQVVAVMSGKGGVGKSYVTSGLACGAASRTDGGIGVLDADLSGPTVAAMLGARGPLRVGEDGVEPAVGIGGVRVFSTDLLLEEGQPLRWKEPRSEQFVWRGIRETGAVREFLSDVAWGPLDLLLIDLPPGSGQLSDLADIVPQLAGAVGVTIPSEESRRSVGRALRAATDSGVRILGIVENMVGYLCAACGATRALFAGSAGSELAEQFGVPLLGRIPFYPTVRRSDGPTGEGGGKGGTEDAGSVAPAAPQVPVQVVERFLGVLA